VWTPLLPDIGDAIKKMDEKIGDVIQKVQETSPQYYSRK
jgi:hypothetical protein